MININIINIIIKYLFHLMAMNIFYLFRKIEGLNLKFGLNVFVGGAYIRGGLYSERNFC